MLASYDYDNLSRDPFEATAEIDNDLMRGFDRLGIPHAYFKVIRTSPGHYRADVTANITFARAIALGRLLKCSQDYIDFVERTGHFTARTSRKATGQPTPREVAP